jgi:hypothetical protein
LTPVTPGRNLPARVALSARFRRERAICEGIPMTLSTILIIVLILVLIGALPRWGYSSGWGYGPGGIVGLILIIVIILALMGRL